VGSGRGRRGTLKSGIVLPYRYTADRLWGGGTGDVVEVVRRDGGVGYSIVDSSQETGLERKGGLCGFRGCAGGG
jgi:hypothetical protein